jgi:hypothetical protein
MAILHLFIHPSEPCIFAIFRCKFGKIKRLTNLLYRKRTKKVHLNTFASVDQNPKYLAEFSSHVVESSSYLSGF